jgi:hypothetical protein
VAVSVIYIGVTHVALGTLVASGRLGWDPWRTKALDRLLWLDNGQEASVDCVLYGAGSVGARVRVPPKAVVGLSLAQGTYRLNVRSRGRTPVEDAYLQVGDSDATLVYNVGGANRYKVEARQYW